MRSRLRTNLMMMTIVTVLACGSGASPRHVKVFSRPAPRMVVGNQLNRTYIIDESRQRCFLQYDDLISEIDCDTVPSEELVSTGH